MLSLSRATDTTTSNPRRLYQVWKGKNKFFCGGRLIFGPDVASLFLSMFLIAGPSIAFCIQASLKISNGDGQSQVLGLPTLIVALFVTMADIIFLFMTSSRDPGIVPRNAYPPESDEAFDVTTPSMEWINGTAPHLRLPRTKDVTVNGFVVKVKFCDTCLLYRPSRASHCSICNNCVQKFDHHCPWVGQCIGLRNYRFFFMFISSSTFLCVYVFTFSWLNVLGEKENYGGSVVKSLTGEVVSLVLIVYTFVVVWFVGGLTVFHFYLISTNQTTYENFRYRYDKKENPYSKGILGNFKDVFFSKMPLSMNDFRSWVIEESVERIPIIDIGSDIYTPKEKMDLEMGRSGEPGKNKSSMPNILRDLDYSSIDENLKAGAGHGKQEHDEDDENVPFAFPILREPGNVHGLRDTNQCCIAAASQARVADESAHEEAISSGIVMGPARAP